MLPFDNMSGDAEQEYFSDGITEDIITELSRFSGLFVIARNSSFAFKGKPVDVKRVAGELGVRYVLEGSIRRSGNRVRITAQLIDADGGSHIWAERYDRELEDIFDLQEEITRNVVSSIAPQIEMAEIDRARRAASPSISSYDLSLRALTYFYDGARMGDSALEQRAIDTAKESLEKDPRNLHALWVLALAYVEQYVYQWGPAPESSLEKAGETAQYLLEIDSTNAHGHMVRGMFHALNGAHDEALADCRRAFAINPNFAMNIFAMAWCESLTTETDTAREHAELGLRLSPRDNDVWLGVAYLALAQASFADGDYEKTQEWGRLAIQMHPKAPIRRTLMIACLGAAGNKAAAAEHIATLKSFSPDFLPSVLSGEVTFYQVPEVNARLVEGIKLAGG